MDLRMRKSAVFNIWPSFTDVALSMLLIFLFFLFIQFIANSKAILRIRMEKKQNVIKGLFEGKFKDEIEKGEIRIIIDGNLQRFTFSDRVLFDSGEAVLKKGGREILATVGRLLRDNRYIRYEKGNWQELYKSIQINGHTDNVPINTEQFPSNWELSSARAMAVLRFFEIESQIDPSVMLSTGYGEYHPIATNKTKRGRAKNRRIEIILVYSEKRVPSAGEVKE